MEPDFVSYPRAVSAANGGGPTSFGTTSSGTPNFFRTVPDQAEVVRLVKGSIDPKILRCLRNVSINLYDNKYEIITEFQILKIICHAFLKIYISINLQAGNRFPGKIPGTRPFLDICGGFPSRIALGSSLRHLSFGDVDVLPFNFCCAHDAVSAMTDALEEMGRRLLSATEAQITVCSFSTSMKAASWKLAIDEVVDEEDVEAGLLGMTTFLKVQLVLRLFDSVRDALSGFDFSLLLLP